MLARKHLMLAVGRCGADIGLSICPSPFRSGVFAKGRPLIVPIVMGERLRFDSTVPHDVVMRVDGVDGAYRFVRQLRDFAAKRLDKID